MNDDDKHVNPEEIEKLGELARISLSQEQIQNLEGDISEILAYVAEIDEIDTGAVEREKPQLRNVMREDVVTSTASCAEEVLAQAPDVRDGYVVVKKILH